MGLAFCIHLDANFPASLRLKPALAMQSHRMEVVLLSSNCANFSVVAILSMYGVRKQWLVLEMTGSTDIIVGYVLVGSKLCVV